MTTVDQTGARLPRAQARDLTDDRARAERVAAERRRKVALQNLGIRLVALDDRAVALADRRDEHRSGAVHHADQGLLCRGQHDLERRAVAGDYGRA